MKKNVLLILLLISASWMLKAQSYSGGSGTEGNPFQIANKTDLKYLSENYTHYDGYYFIQTADIYFLASDFQSSGDFYYGGAGFLPIGAGIGTTNIRFKSSYDGNNFIIDGIYMNRSEDDVGFFGEVAEYRMSVSPWTVLHTPTIENVTLTNVNITNTGALTGGLVGQFFDGTISNCSVSGSVTGTQAGGITGQNEFSGTIEKSRSNVSVTGTFQVGGLLGYAGGNVSCCYSSGDVTGNSSTGGFVGVVGEDVTISNSYSTGNVVRATSSTNSYFGGFCGYVSGVGMAGGPGTIQNCYSIGDVTYAGASDPTDKGFCGQSDGGTFTDNFFDSEASNQTAANGATAKNTTQMKTQSTFTNWDFSTVWEIIGGNGASYPTLRDNPEPSSVVTPTTQALNIVFSSVQTTQMTVSWTNGNGANRVVFAKQANTGTTSPVANTTYISSTDFGSGTVIATGWYCVYNGNGSSVSVSNLTQGTDYIFQVFEYNGGAGEELYLTSTTTNNPKAQTTIGTPTTQSSNILFSDVQTTQMTVSWTDGNGANRVVFAKQANTGTTSPVGNTTYTANTSFGSGTEIATGWYCVYNGSGSSVSVTNLTAESDYIFQVCEYNGGSGEELYLSTTTSDNPKSQATTAPPSEPTTQAIDIVFSDVQSNQMTVAWTDGNGSSRVVFAKQATTGTTAPVDNATYAASTSFGSGTEIATGWYCVYNGSGSSVTVSGLTVNTTYIFQVFEYNGGSGEENYLITTATNNPKPRLTLSSDKTSYTYTGTTETWIVPAGVTEVLVKAWGAGGAGSTYGATPPAGADGGGSGGYATATLTVTPGQELIIAVGGGGKHGIRDIAGGLGGWPGGGYGTKGDGAGGGGGGYSGVFLSSLDQANALIIAGAGGGGTGFRVGGAGGGTTGNRGGTDGGYGGTQSAGGSGTTYGADGSALQGGNGDTRGQIDDLSYDGGGGGGGYYGGEGGYSDAKGAGGGSGFLHPTLANGSFITGQDGQPLAGGTAPNNTDEDYIAGVGNGSNGPDDAGNGLIVISYSLPTPPATLTWTGTVDSDWNTAGNWDLNALPVSSTDIIISDVVNDPIVASGANASCYNLTVEAGASLTINSGGSLITNGTITNNGTINIKRNITSGVWHLISNPITSATANIFVGNYLQNWDETSGTWSDIVETSTSLTPVKGYSLWTIDGTPTDYTFTGTPNTGNQSTGITANGSGGSYNGANLLGNPYPSSIDWSGLDDTYGAVNYWNGTGYVSWNNGSGSGSQYIPPMQGFFIVTGTAGTFSVGNANRTHTGATNYYKSLTDLSAGLVLFADNGSYRDDLWLLQRENRHAGFDLESDAYKFMSSTPGISQLWSVCPDGNLSIDARPYQETIQLGFANDVAGLYTIGISEIADITTAILQDTKENTFHDLTKGAYEFAWDVNDDENRFNLHLNVVGLEETPGNESNILIYATNGNIFIKGAEKGEARVSDLMGRIVLQQQINGKEIVSIPANLKTGIYLVMVQQGKEVKTEKIFIR